MNRMNRLCAGILLVVSLVATPAGAIDLGGIVGGLAGGFLVDQLAEPLNKFINIVTFNKGIQAEKFTKVVPILSIGSGARIGAAQVSGPSKDGVQRCKAVAQFEADFKGRIRAKILIPVDSVNPSQRFRRVHGVGVSAVIDVKL